MDSYQILKKKEAQTEEHQNLIVNGISLGLERYFEEIRKNHNKNPNNFLGNTRKRQDLILNNQSCLFSYNN